METNGSKAGKAGGSEGDSVPGYSSRLRNEVSMGQPENGTKVLKPKVGNESCSLIFI